MIDTVEVFSSLRALVPKAAAMPFRCEWDIPADLPYFAGHFPGNPVFPAVGIVDASLCLVTALNAALGRAAGTDLSAVSSAKFMRPMTPGLRVQVEATAVEAETPETSTWDVRWSDAGADLALLRLVLNGAGA
jgi:3-hydroxyacyl-[acyl-carrier-protein] dehydratase